jgi:hypothetical protein
MYITGGCLNTLVVQLMGHMGLIMDEKFLMCKMKKSLVENVVVA